jgi:hypothetical protein
MHQKIIKTSVNKVKKKTTCWNVIDVDWGLVINLALTANEVFGIYDRSH